MPCRIYGVGFALALASTLSVACSSSETSLTGPTTDGKCQITTSSSPSSFSASGGPGTVTISTARDCTWSVATNTTWVTLGDIRSGQGEASIAYKVAPNPVPTPRSGAIVVSAQTVEVSQSAAPCQYALSRTRDSIAGEGGRLSFDVTTLTGCSWNATSSAGWITITSGQSGTASGSVGLTIAANSGVQRAGDVNVAGQTYTVTQSAAPPPPPPTPPTTPAPPPEPSPQPPSPPPPTPGPTPVPAPPPPPPPGTGQRVAFDITVSGLSGRCPNVTFIARGVPIATDSSTDFRKGGCNDLRNGRDVSVEGVVQSNRTIRATTIEIRKDSNQ